MTLGPRIIYGAVLAAAIFFVGQFVLAAGSFLINLVFAIVMGAVAIAAITVAMRMSGRK